jgi:hypothetical protein
LADAVGVVGAVRSLAARVAAAGVRLPVCSVTTGAASALPELILRGLCLADVPVEARVERADDAAPLDAEELLVDA